MPNLKINLKNMNIKILGDRVLVEPIIVEEKTNSGFLVKKDKDHGDIQEGKIVSVGSGKRTSSGDLIEVNLKTGDKVLFNYGTTVRIEGKSYLLVNEADVLMVI